MLSVCPDFVIIGVLRFSQNTKETLFMTIKKVLPLILATLIIFSTMVCAFAQSISHSIYGDYGVASNFGTGSYHTVLEIYAPADLTDGAFIKNFSQYPYEQEILLDCNQSYKVLDAGVRIKNVTDFSGNTEEMTERFIKLIIVDNDKA